MEGVKRLNMKEAEEKRKTSEGSCKKKLLEWIARWNRFAEKMQPKCNVCRREILKGWG